jgi:hypothetical protein
MWLLMEEEILPGIERAKAPSYRTALTDPMREPSVVLGVYDHQGQRIGESRREVIAYDNGTYRVDNVTERKYGAFGNVRVHMKTWVDEKFKFERMTTEAILPGPMGRAMLTAERKGQGSNMTVLVTVKSDTLLGSADMQRHIPYDPNATFASEFDPFMSMPHLEVGKEWTMSMASIQGLLGGGGDMKPVQARVDRTEPLEFDNIMLEVFVVRMEFDMALSKMVAEAYITPNGTVLKQDLISQKIMLWRETPLPEWDKPR